MKGILLLVVRFQELHTHYIKYGRPLELLAVNLEEDLE